MVVFFKIGAGRVIAVETDHRFSPQEIEKLSWLFDGARALTSTTVKGRFIGPRREMITPWSTNAVEITQNMGMEGITRIEQFELTREDPPKFDKMLQRVYDNLNSRIFTVKTKPAPIVYIEDIHEYNRMEGLALSPDEEEYLNNLSKKLKRPLTDSEVFGFSQVNSEHCRHKIFNGTFIIDGKEKPLSLFKLIKKTSQENPNTLVSAYKDNVAFVKGPVIDQFAPVNPEQADYFEVTPLQTVLSLKAETHNFPTTVEPFNGAATGSGGEIRDRLGGGRASLPLAGTAVYMTSYPRLSPEHRW
ncbi:MAG: phosphoribosylformylglycinamidine synthase, partial [Paramuribaculum sp.]|nr:phosphoribosylformylglycinamidine synthase [Paramuribaculum sp.]